MSLALKLQSWAPTQCADCAACMPSRREETQSLTSFEKRKKVAAAQAVTVRTAWAVLHICIMATVLATETDLRFSWVAHRILYISAYLLLAATNIALYVSLCTGNPGWLQPGVHALSLSTMKRDSQGLTEEDAAEMGIGGLAHMEIPLIGRRHATLGHVSRDRLQPYGSPRNPLDRTTTLPNLPSQFSGEHLGGLLDQHPGEIDRMPSRTLSTPWEALPSGDGLGPFGGVTSPRTAEMSAGNVLQEVSIDSTAGILASGDKAAGGFGSKGAIPGAARAARVRGWSVGGADELGGPFAARAKSGQEAWVDGKEEGQPLLHHTERRSASSSEKTSPAMSTQVSSEVPGLSLERKPSKPLSPANTRRQERPVAWWEGPNPGRWCEFCGAWQLLRSRHCHECARCVRRFDHHCAWVGRCIGQDNHLRFWWYLVVQLLLLIWTTHSALSGFQAPVPHHHRRLHLHIYPSTIALVVSLALLIFLTGFVALLLGYHTYLVATGQTTFELAFGAKRVAYLRHLPAGARPFSEGLLGNIASFCCGPPGVSYQMPAALSGSGRRF